MAAKEKKSKGPPPAPDVYVALLFAALAAITTGCILLALELDAYGWQLPT